jgi:hypothetical protein
MAKLKDIQIITIIRYEMEKAKRGGKSINVELSGGEDYYLGAIGSIRRVGLFGLITFPLAAALYLLLNIMDYMRNGIGNIAGVIVVGLLVSAIPVFLSYRLYTLRATPVFILVSLIINLLFCILFFAGILPIALAVLIIIALTRWGLYRDWFNNIDVAHYKERAKR